MGTDPQKALGSQAPTFEFMVSKRGVERIAASQKTSIEGIQSLKGNEIRVEYGPSTNNQVTHSPDIDTEVNQSLPHGQSDEVNHSLPMGKSDIGIEELLRHGKMHIKFQVQDQVQNEADKDKKVNFAS